MREEFEIFNTRTGKIYTPKRGIMQHKPNVTAELLAHQYIWEVPVLNFGLKTGYLHLGFMVSFSPSI
jgi:hypothetical protein